MLLGEERVGVRTTHHKYVRWEDGREEAYDLAADPQERRDLAGIDDILNPLRQLSAQVDVGVKVPFPTTQSSPDRRTLEALRSLGYVD